MIPSWVERCLVISLSCPACSRCELPLLPHSIPFILFLRYQNYFTLLQHYYFLYISCAFPILLVTAWQECGRYQLKWHHSHSIRPTLGPHGFVRQDLNLYYFAFCCSSAAHYSAPICNSVFFGFSTFASLSGTLPSQLGNATSLQCL